MSAQLSFMPFFLLFPQFGVNLKGPGRGLFPTAEKSGLGPQLPTTGLRGAFPNCHPVNPSKKEKEKKGKGERETIPQIVG